MGAIESAGREGARILELLAWMAGGGLLVWLVVVALTLHATYLKRTPLSARSAWRLVLWGGAILPTLLLTALLVYGLALLPPILEPAPAGSLRIEVTAHQYWWRMRYAPPGEAPVELANELWLPVDRPVEVELAAADVIHSFWVPALAVKMDAIPGRRTRLKLHATRPGTYPGVCAEYCGASHAFMRFEVRVVPEEAFGAWLARQRGPARAPATPLAERGRAAFLANGCGACHTIRGTAADGGVGPDLTHVGGRGAIAAGRLRTGSPELHRWISRPAALKPEVRMPAFHMLPPGELEAMADYLGSLE